MILCFKCELEHPVFEMLIEDTMYKYVFMKVLKGWGRSVWG